MKCGRFALEPSGGVVGCGVHGPPVQVSGAGCDACGCEGRCPFVFGECEQLRSTSECFGRRRGESDGIRIVDSGEAFPVERLDGGVPVDAFEMDGARPCGVVDVVDVTDVVAVDCTYPSPDVYAGACGGGGDKLRSLLGRVVDAAVVS